jgi:LuxR family maltose regulon positive regulatory protein
MAAQSSWSTLNTTKHYIPPMPEDFVPRLRLADRLDLIPKRPLALVSAPAGYGKSTAVAAWLQTSVFHRAWYALDDADNDLTVFMIYFLAAIRRAAPSFGVELGAALEAGRTLSGSEFVESVFAELNRLDRDVVLVIEDCHLIRAADVLGVLRELMRHPHPLLHLVLLSRHDLPLPLSDWRARNLMIEVRAADLRFSLEETSRFLRNALGEGVNDEMIARLHQNTEGWVAGLRLALLSLTQVEDVGDQVLELSAHNRHIVEYLADQVLSGLPADQQAFLIQTSILERLSGPLCEAVVAPNGVAPNGVAPNGLASSGVAFDGKSLDGQAILTYLYRENLFIIPLDAEMSWFRYHHLLSDFLRGRLSRRYSKEAIAGLHLRAGRWFAAAGYTEEAIRHTLAAGAMEEAITHLAAKRHDLLNREQWQRLLSWYSLFPEHVVNTSPDLLIIKAWSAHSLRFDMEAVRAIADQIEVLLEELDLGPLKKDRLRAENDILRGLYHYYSLEASECYELCRRSLDILPAEYYAMRSFGWIYSSGARQLVGDMAGAFEICRQGRREDASFPDYPRARNASAEGYLNWMAGDLPGVEQTGKFTLVTAAAGGGQYNSLSWGHYFMASAHYHWNNLEQAEYHAQQVFDNRYVNHAIANIFAGYILSLTHQAAGRPEKAREILTRTAEFAIDVRSQPMQFMAQTFQTELDIRQGQADHAARWAKRYLPTVPMRAMPFFYAPQLTILKALLAAGDPSDAELVRDYLQTLRDHVEAIHNTRFLIEVLALEALFRDARGEEREALAALEQSLALARPSRFIRLYVDLGPGIKALLGRLPARRELAGYVAQIAAAFPMSKPAPSDGGLVDPLTDREYEILTLLAKRFSNKEIAAELVISPMTVKRHTINIYQKLFVQSRREAVEAAQGLGIIE